MPPKVSVVIKSYNHAAFIGQAIRSILEQSFQDFEIIVTDDCSTDGTPDIVRQFDDNRIKLEVLPENHGISLAMNAAISRASGEYIAILNSDDYALPGRLETQVNFLNSRPDVSVVAGLPEPVDDHGRKCVSHNDFYRPLSFPDFDNATWLHSFFFERNCICAPTVMIRRSVYHDVGGYNPKLTNLQDFEMWLRILMSGHMIWVLNAKLTAFRVRSGLKNMGAPRPDSLLRCRFELSQILMLYANMNIALLQQVFAREIKKLDIDTIKKPGLLIAEIARSVKSSVYAFVAVQLAYNHSESLDELHKLKRISGENDIFTVPVYKKILLRCTYCWKAYALLRRFINPLKKFNSLKK